MEFSEKLNKIKQSIGPLFSKNQLFLSQPKNNVVSPKIAAIMNSSSSSFGSKLPLNYANPNNSENFNSAQYSTTTKLNDTSSLGHLKNPSKAEYQRYKQILFSKPTTSSNNNKSSSNVQRASSPLAGEIIAKRAKKQNNTQLDLKQQHSSQGSSYLLEVLAGNKQESQLSSKSIINSKKSQISQQYPSNYSSIQGQSNQSITDSSMLSLSPNMNSNRLTNISGMVHRNTTNVRDVNDSTEIISAALEQEFSCVLGSSVEGKQFAEWVNNLGVEEDLQESEAAIRSLKEQQRVLQGERERLAEEIHELNEIQLKKGNNNKRKNEQINMRARNNRTVAPERIGGGIASSECQEFEEMWKQLEDKEDKYNQEQERQDCRKIQQRIVDDDEWLDGLLTEGDNNNNRYEDYLQLEEEQESQMNQQQAPNGTNQVAINALQMNSTNKNIQKAQNMPVLSQEGKGNEMIVRTPRELKNTDQQTRQGSSKNSTQFMQRDVSKDRFESNSTENSNYSGFKTQLKSNTNSNNNNSNSILNNQGLQLSGQQNKESFEQSIELKQNRVQSMQPQETTKQGTQSQPNYANKQSNKGDNYQIRQGQQQHRDVDRTVQYTEEREDYHDWQEDNTHSTDQLKQYQQYEQTKQDTKQQNSSQQLPTINRELIDNLAEEVEMLMRLQNLKHEKVDELELGYQQTFAELEAASKDDNRSWMKSQQIDLYEIQEEEDHSIDEEHSIVQHTHNYDDNE